MEKLIISQIWRLDVHPDCRDGDRDMQENSPYVGSGDIVSSRWIFFYFFLFPTTPLLYILFKERNIPNLYSSPFKTRVKSQISWIFLSKVMTVSFALLPFTSQWFGAKDANSQSPEAPKFFLRLTSLSQEFGLWNIWGIYESTRHEQGSPCPVDLPHPIAPRIPVPLRACALCPPVRPSPMPFDPAMWHRHLTHMCPQGVRT